MSHIYKYLRLNTDISELVLLLILANEGVELAKLSDLST